MLPILSICIPTFNRVVFLAESLNAIANQLNELNYSKVELVISDNASPDNTEQFIADFMLSYPQIQVVYFRQLSNIGADGNINTVINLAKGEFLYILSDDDILLPGAMSNILSLIQQNPAINAFCLNLVIFTNTITKASQPTFNVTQDYIINNREEVLIFLGTWITFLSIIVFKKQTLIGKNYADRIGSNFLHSFVFLDVLAQTGGFYVTSEPFLAMRGGNTGGYNFFKTFITDFAMLLKYAENLGFAKSAIKQVLSRHRRFIYSFVLTFKVDNAYGGFKPDYQDGLRRLVKVYYYDPLFLGGMISFMLMPQIFIQQLFRLRQWYRGKVL